MWAWLTKWNERARSCCRPSLGSRWRRPGRGSGALHGRLAEDARGEAERPPGRPSAEVVQPSVDGDDTLVEIPLAERGEAADRFDLRLLLRIVGEEHRPSELVAGLVVAAEERQRLAVAHPDPTSGASRGVLGVAPGHRVIADGDVRGRLPAGLLGGQKRERPGPVTCRRPRRSGTPGRRRAGRPGRPPRTRSTSTARPDRPRWTERSLRPVPGGVAVQRDGSIPARTDSRTRSW